MHCEIHGMETVCKDRRSRPGPSGEGSPLLGVGLHGLLLAFPPPQVLACILVGLFVCPITLACTTANCQQTFDQQLALQKT